MSLVLPGVAGNDDEHGEVNQGLARSVLTVEVCGLVLAPRSGGLLRSRSRSRRQLLVEGNHVGHAFGVGVGPDVLNVSIGRRRRAIIRPIVNGPLAFNLGKTNTCILDT